jgi:hypothetical protein
MFERELLTQNGSMRVDRLPPNCPRCGTSLVEHPYWLEFVAAVYFDLSEPARNEDLGARIRRSKFFRIDAFFRCNGCRDTFMARYGGLKEELMGRIGNLESVEPIRPSRLDVPAEVATLSPRFVEIVNQAKAAEDYSLDEVCGVGYRKALEFLIKDFCIALHPDKTTDIKRQLLGECITTYVTDADVREIARRAAWLGNDETHYERRWIDKDLEDLKHVLELTVVWIKNQLRTKKYLTEMTRGER